MSQFAPDNGSNGRTDAGSVPPWIPPQGIGPHFHIGVDGKIDIAPPDALDHDGNYLPTLQSLHPELRKLAISLYQRLPVGNNPHPMLGERIFAYRTLIDQDLAQIDFRQLYLVGIRLHNGLSATDRAIAAKEVPTLNPEAREEIDSLLEAHGPFILATAAGGEAIAAAERYKRQPEEERAYREAATEFSKTLSDAPDVITPHAAKIVAAAADIVGMGTQPERSAVIGQSTVRNAIITLLSGAVIVALPTGGLAIAGPIGGIAGTALAWGAFKSLEKSDAGQQTVEFGKEKFNSLTLKIIPEALKTLQTSLRPLRNFVASTVLTLRRLSSSGFEESWIDRNLAWLETLARNSDTGNVDTTEVGLTSKLAAYTPTDQLLRKEYPLNPNPYQTGEYVHTAAYLICGGFRDRLNIQPLFENTPINLSPLLQPIYDSIVERFKEDARQHDLPLWNGPLVRLDRIDMYGSHERENHEEQAVYRLHLRPISYFNFMVLNRHLDDLAIRLGNRATIREQFADELELYSRQMDLSWCKLSNNLTVSMVPITSDGYGMFGLRGSAANNVDHGIYAPGVSEGMNQFLDECDASGKAVHPYRLAVNRRSEKRRTIGYVPTGTPHPLLTAKRGFFEEVSEQDQEGMDFKFLNIGWTQYEFQPIIIGVIDTGLTRYSLESALRESYGKDHVENKARAYFRLSLRDSETRQQLESPNRWDQGGRAALITAINYWRLTHGS